MLRLALLENLRRVVAGGDGRAARPRARCVLGRADARASRPRARRDVVLVLAEMVEANPPLTQRVRGGAREPPAGQGRRRCCSRCRGSSNALRSGADRRARVPAGEPEPGGRPGRDRQHHRQPALPRRDRLARLRRGDERGRTDAAHRSCRRLRGDGLRDARSATATSSKRSRGAAPCPSTTSRARRRAATTRARAEAPRWPRAARHVGLLPRRRRPPTPRTRRRTCGGPWTSSRGRHRPRRFAVYVYAGAIDGSRRSLPAILPIASHRSRFARWGLALARSRIARDRAPASSRSRCVHWAATLLVRPTILPRLDFSTGIPAEHIARRRGARRC